MKKIILLLSAIFIMLFDKNPSLAQIINGNFSNGLDGWNIFGDVTVSEEGMAIMKTGGIDGPYLTTLSTDFIVTGTKLSFKYFLENAGPDDIKYPGFPSFGPDFLQLTLSAGGIYHEDITLAWTATDGLIPLTVDISSIPAGTFATLSFTLFDEDDGNMSIAGIDDVSDPGKTVPEPSTLLLLGSGLVGLYIFSRKVRRNSYILFPLVLVYLFYNPGISLSEMVEEHVNDLVNIEFTSPAFNTIDNILSLDMVITNISDLSLHVPAKVVITGISVSNVTVVNPDGYTLDGKPYFDLTHYMGDEVLLPGNRVIVRISFHNPERVRFRWDQDMIAMIDIPTSGPIIDNICIVPGESHPVCEFSMEDFSSKNPDFDRILKEPLPAMYIDSQIRVYAFNMDGKPLSVTINDGDATYDEAGFYYYRNITLVEGVNQLVIRASDSSGTVERNITLHIDSTPPSISIISPSGSFRFLDSTQEIRGIIDDPEISSVLMWRDFSFQEEIPVIEGMFTTEVILESGHNLFTFEATDRAGNTSHISIDLLFVYSDKGKIEGLTYSIPLGLPLAGATVTAISEDGTISTLSGDDGSFSIDNLKSGDIMLQVEKEGYGSAEFQVFLAGGDTSLVKDIGLMPLNSPDTLTLTGRITDSAGNPLNGAAVFIEDLPFTSKSDNGGIYVLHGIPKTSFILKAYLDAYEPETVSINSETLSSDTRILTHNFTLQKVSDYLEIISPVENEIVNRDSVLVTGVIRIKEDGRIYINGSPGRIYGESFAGNHVLLKEGVNSITVEVINPSGVILKDSVNVLVNEYIRGPEIHAPEAGLTPGEISAEIRLPDSLSFTNTDLTVEGPGEVSILKDNLLSYRIYIKEPGIYTITFTGNNEEGTFTDRFAFVGIGRYELENKLQTLWNSFKGYLRTDNIEEALSLFTPQTRSRYREQFLLLKDRLPEIFAGIGDIQLIHLKDSVAKTRIRIEDITYYVWFVKDMYGRWRIHKF